MSQYSGILKKVGLYSISLETAIARLKFRKKFDDKVEEVEHVLSFVLDFNFQMK